MNPIFMISFLILLGISGVGDRKVLKTEKRSKRYLYGILTLMALGLFISKLMHVHIPMLPSFFINRVSPWVMHIIGL